MCHRSRRGRWSGTSSRLALAEEAVPRAPLPPRRARVKEVLRALLPLLLARRRPGLTFLAVGAADAEAGAAASRAAAGVAVR
jgi:hypothetical protein